MSDFKNGISFYTVGWLHTQVFFPERELKCKYCSFLSWDGKLNIGRCRVTGKMIYSPEYIPNNCPLEFKEDID
jgi:hypothetical protein